MRLLLALTLLVPSLAFAKWTPEQRQGTYDNCVNGITQGQDPVLVNIFCTCAVDLVEKACPKWNPNLNKCVTPKQKQAIGVICLDKVQRAQEQQ